MICWTRRELNLHIKRWAAEDPDRVALIWEKDEPGEAECVTYGQLLEMVGTGKDTAVAI